MRILCFFFLSLGLAETPDSDWDDFSLFDDIQIPDDEIEILDEAQDPSMDLLDDLLNYGGLYPSRSARNRVPTHATLRQLTQYTRFIAERFARQIQIDKSHDEFTPQLESDSNCENTPLGNITLGEISETSFSYIEFAIEGDPSIMIRYSHDCNDAPYTPVIHPILQDAFYGQAAHDAGVGLAYHFVSPAAPFPFDRQSRKLNFRMNESQYYACLFSESTVRYVIMERPEQTMLDYVIEEPGAKFEVGYAMQIGKSLIEIVQALHSHGIVHGDIAIDRVSVSSRTNETVKLDFTSFRYASEIDVNGSAVISGPKDPTKLNSVIYSPNELSETKKYGVHDDVFRIVETIAICVYGALDYRAMLREKFENGTLLAWKREGDLFGDLHSLPESVQGHVRSRLQEVLAVVRNTERPVPDYDNIYRLFHEVGVMAFPLSNTEVTTSSPLSNVVVPTSPLPETADTHTVNTRKRPREDSQ